MENIASMSESLIIEGFVNLLAEAPFDALMEFEGAMPMLPQTHNLSSAVGTWDELISAAYTVVRNHDL